MDSVIDWQRLTVAAAGVYLTFSPRDVVFSGWVGDQVHTIACICILAYDLRYLSLSGQDPTFEGLQDAMTKIIYSAWCVWSVFVSCEL